MLLWNRRSWLTLSLGAAGISLLGQEPPERPVEWVCPMDADVRAKAPGKCSRCGMDLVPGIPNPIEFPMRVSISPRNWKAGQPVRLLFEVIDPKTGKRCTKFDVVHEKLFHLFLISQDLDFFAHEHPEPLADGSFEFRTTFPQPGLYRIAGDFYPSGATPQMAVRTMLSAGADISRLSPPRLQADISLKQASNLAVNLKMEPEQPIAGLKTMLFCALDPSDGLEQYLGAWGHLLAGSSDLIDLIHTHPFIADGGPNVQFNIVFPRPGMYRVWVQFQRRGTVNTVAFTIPVRSLS